MISPSSYGDRSALSARAVLTAGMAASGGRPSDGAGPPPAKVLVVDDQEMNVTLLRRALGHHGYEIVTAEGGELALRSIEADPPDVVLMDVQMPDLSGLEVLRRLRDDPRTADLPVILVSGLGETSHIVEGLKLGANDYVTKPINLPVLQARLATQTALKLARDSLKHTAARLAHELDRQAHELRIAAHVQRSILPQGPPASSGLRAAWCYEPATEVGGDLFDVISLPGGRTFLFLADAMGHGVQAALVASTVKGTLGAHLADAEDLPGLMERLDAAVGDLFEDRFVTATACVVDPAARRIRYVNAGHPPILVRGRDRIEALRIGGLPLGVGAGMGFPEGESTLDPGSRLLLYSDGLTEALNADGAQLGIDGLCSRLAELDDPDPDALVRSLRASLRDFQGGTPLADDLTILAGQLL